jgi:hypothetical protein
MKGGENDIFPFPFKGNQVCNLPLATKQDAFQLATKLRTFHWPLSKMLPYRPTSLEPSISH